jgi:hypothetical protein
MLVNSACGITRPIAPTLPLRATDTRLDALDASQGLATPEMLADHHPLRARALLQVCLFAAVGARRNPRNDPRNALY